MNGGYEGFHEGPEYQFGEYIFAVCQPGYALEGGIRRRCNGDDGWSGEDPKCNQGELTFHREK